MGKIITDLTKTALDKEKKNFIRFCNFCSGLCVLLLEFMIVGLVTYGYGLIKCIVVCGTVEEMISNAANLVTCIGIGFSVRFGGMAFSALSKNETPFRYDVADKLKGASVPLIVCGGIVFMAEVAVVIMTEGFGFAADKFDFFGGLDVLLFGIALSALSYIFNYGCKLQQESDETL